MLEIKQKREIKMKMNNKLLEQEIIHRDDLMKSICERWHKDNYKNENDSSPLYNDLTENEQSEILSCSFLADEEWYLSFIDEDCIVQNMLMSFIKIDAKDKNDTLLDIAFEMRAEIRVRMNATYVKSGFINDKLDDAWDHYCATHFNDNISDDRLVQEHLDIVSRIFDSRSASK